MIKSFYVTDIIQISLLALGHYLVLITTLLGIAIPM